MPKNKIFWEYVKTFIPGFLRKNLDYTKVRILENGKHRFFNELDAVNLMRTVRLSKLLL